MVTNRVGTKGGKDSAQITKPVYDSESIIFSKVIPQDEQDEIR